MEIGGANSSAVSELDLYLADSKRCLGTIRASRTTKLYNSSNNRILYCGSETPVGG
jgi:hypothetical protein